MKYRYKLTIEDATKDEEILIMEGQGVSRNIEGCYKAVRRTITHSIKEYIDRAASRSLSLNCPEGPESKRSTV